MSHQKRYLTAITWPEGFDRPQIAALLAEATGFDVVTMRQRCAVHPPCILGLFDAQPADAGAQALVDSGGDGFSFSLAELESLGPTHKVRDMQLTPEGLRLDVWRGEPRLVDPSTIDVIIRGAISTTETEPQANGSARAIRGTLMSPMAGAAYLAGGVGGLAFMLYARQLTEGPELPESRTTTSHKLDFHAADVDGNRAVFQIDGDKFAYQILGDGRGHSDNENIDRMCELLRSFSPDAVVDSYFPYWKRPVAVHRLRLPGMRINNEDPAFAFYSRWSAVMYRHVIWGKAFDL